MKTLILAAVLQASLPSVTVVDGDTLHDNRQNRDYRLYGVDAPETERALCAAEKAFGEAAAARVAELLAGAKVVRALPGWDPRGRDRWPRDGFGRRIAVIELDGVSLGDTLLAEGLARPYSGNGPRPDWCAG
jgi:micrococcal nuclease